MELEGTRYNIGVKYGMLTAELALALSGGDREEILRPAGRTTRRTMTPQRQLPSRIPNPQSLIPFPSPPHVARSDRDYHQRRRGDPQSFAGGVLRADAAALLEAAAALDGFRRASDNLYERVRAIFFLAAIYRYHLPQKLPADARGLLPFDGYAHLLNRRFEESVDEFLAAARRQGPGDSIASGLATAYHALGSQTLSDQVRRSVRSFAATNGCFAWVNIDIKMSGSVLIRFGCLIRQYHLEIYVFAICG